MPSELDARASTRRRRLLLAAAAVAVLLGACGSASGDAEALCDVARTVASDPSIAADRKVQRVFERFERERSMTSGTRTTLQAAASTDAATKYRILQQGFLEQGVDGWTCPELERLLAPP